MVMTIPLMTILLLMHDGEEQLQLLLLVVMNMTREG